MSELSFARKTPTALGGEIIKSRTRVDSKTRMQDYVNYVNRPSRALLWESRIAAARHTDQEIIEHWDIKFNSFLRLEDDRFAFISFSQFNNIFYLSIIPAVESSTTLVEDHLKIKEVVDSLTLSIEEE